MMYEKLVWNISNRSKLSITPKSDWDMIMIDSKMRASRVLGQSLSYSNRVFRVSILWGTSFLTTIHTSIPFNDGIWLIIGESSEISISSIALFPSEVFVLFMESYSVIFTSIVIILASEIVALLLVQIYEKFNLKEMMDFIITYDKELYCLWLAHK